MIRHIVFWTFHPTANGCLKMENIKIASEMLQSLKEKISSVQHLETGINITAGTEAFDLALMCEFKDEAGLREYQTHPEHLKVVSFLKKVREKRAVIDYEI